MKYASGKQFHIPQNVADKSHLHVGQRDILAYALDFFGLTTYFSLFTSIYRPGEGGGFTLRISWVRRRAIGKGIDFHDFVIRNGIDFRDLGIVNKELACLFH